MTFWKDFILHFHRRTQHLGRSKILLLGKGSSPRWRTEQTPQGMGMSSRLPELREHLDSALMHRVGLLGCLDSMILVGPFQLRIFHDPMREKQHGKRPKQALAAPFSHNPHNFSQILSAPGWFSPGSLCSTTPSGGAFVCVLLGGASLPC